MNSTDASNSTARQMMGAGALLALLVAGMMLAQPRAGAEVQVAASAAPAYVVALVEPATALTASVDWSRVPLGADPSAVAVAAYGN